MIGNNGRQLSRRKFLGTTGAAAAGLAGTTFLSRRAQSQDGISASGRRVAFVCDPADPVASGATVQWAMNELSDALLARGLPVAKVTQVSSAKLEDFCILIGGRTSPRTASLLEQNKLPLQATPESLALASIRAADRPALLACGADARGLSYALAELTDRVAYASDPLADLNFPHPVVEQPANEVRCVARVFASDVEDKPWFNDKAFWRSYLSMLARQRFNRFNFTTGLGYDFTRNIRDAYLHFAYPFLVDVPGYQVRAVNLPDAERDANLEMLKFISEEAVARGLTFQLGLWTHAYIWTNSPNANYTIEGLNPENHAAYCRDAITAVLKACPAIGAVTIRTHGESGIAEGSYDLWQKVFEGVAACGRTVEIDLHAKGIDQEMIDRALATGMPVNVSPKFWAEHMGLPYHQAAIRELEMPPPPDKAVKGFYEKSEGTRRFMRYGYGDLFQSDRKYGVTFRIWPGTQRLLLWGNPKMAAAYSRAAGFCGSRGMEVQEPLSFKGRKGSGLSGGRTAYQKDELRPEYDWEKYEYTYRLWGRMLYNPDSAPDSWEHFLSKQWGDAAKPTRAALAAASGILPLVTTAHLPSAANNHYWPEMYWNMSIVEPAVKHPYSDSPVPKRFGTVSPADPMLFSSVDECAAQLLSGELSGKYSPLEVAQWLEGMAGMTAANLIEASQKVAFDSRPELQRVGIDAAILCELGRFFADKLRAGVLYSIYQQTGERQALEQSLATYRRARAAWEKLAARADGVYAKDVTFGPEYYQRGHWPDRLAAIHEDIERMAKLLETAGGGATEAKTQPIDPARVHSAIRALGSTERPRIKCLHEPPESFRPGQPLAIELSAPSDGTNSLKQVRLQYRHVNQAEGYQNQVMDPGVDRWQATIPAAYTQSPFALQYFFELRNEAGQAWLYPGFDANLCNQPYYVIQQA